MPLRMHVPVYDTFVDLAEHFTWPIVSEFLHCPAESGACNIMAQNAVCAGWSSQDLGGADVTQDNRPTHTFRL